MPTIGVEKNAFLAGIGRDAGKVTQEELENLFFDLGLELDDIEEEAGKVREKFGKILFFREKTSDSESSIFCEKKWKLSKCLLYDELNGQSFNCTRKISSFSQNNFGVFTVEFLIFFST